MFKFNTILLVDDDPAMNFLSVELLEEMHAAKQVKVALNGYAAQNIMEQGECPDLVFLDIRMPGMDGFGLLDVIQQNKECQSARIVMLTSSLRPEDKQKALAYKQVIGYYEKPLSEKIIAQVITQSN